MNGWVGQEKKSAEKVIRPFGEPRVHENGNW